MATSPDWDSVREAAYRHAAAGRPVFPCGADKRPLTPNGFKDATTDPTQIALWWGRWPTALIGIPTGPASGMVVLDVDVREYVDGTDSLRALEARHGPLPNTPVTLTPNNGFHYAFADPGFETRNSVNKLGPGLDWRGVGGYVIAEGSILPDGRAYELEASSPEELAPVPAWLLRALGGDPKPAPAAVPSQRDSAPQGERNDYLARYVGTLAHAGLSQDQIYAAVLAENDRACVPPLSRDEIARTVMKSATKWVRMGDGTDVNLNDVPLPLSLEDFQAAEFRPSEPLLGPFTLQQLVLVHAVAGVGKTLFALALCRAFALQQEFLGWQPHRKAKVLYIDGEMPGVMLQERLKGVTHCPGLWLMNLPSYAASRGLNPINVAEEASQRVVEAWIEATQADVVILDNLMALAFVAGVSVSSDEFWMPISRWLMKLRGEGKTIIIIDHSNLAGTVHGTKTKTWHVDLELKLTPGNFDEEGDDHPTLRGTKKQTKIHVKFGKVRVPVGHDGGTGEWDDRVYVERLATLGPVSHDWDWTAGRIGLKMRAREMRENKLSIRDIAEEIGVPKSTIARWVK